MTKVTLDTKQITHCARKGCTNPGPYFRHHLGNDGLLAAMGFIWSRKTYHRYYSTRKVCDTHHMECHYLYEQMVPVASWKIWPGTLKQAHKRFVALRNQYISIGKRFLNGDIDEPVVPPWYKEKWQRSKSTWLVRRSTQGRVTKVTPLNPNKIRFDFE